MLFSRVAHEVERKGTMDSPWVVYSLLVIFFLGLLGMVFVILKDPQAQTLPLVKPDKLAEATQAPGEKDEPATQVQAATQEGKPSERPDVTS